MGLRETYVISERESDEQKMKLANRVLRSFRLFIQRTGSSGKKLPTRPVKGTKATALGVAFSKFTNVPELHGTRLFFIFGNIGRNLGDAYFNWKNDIVGVNVPWGGVTEISGADLRELVDERASVIAHEITHAIDYRRHPGSHSDLAQAAQSFDDSDESSYYRNHLETNAYLQQAFSDFTESLRKKLSLSDKVLSSANLRTLVPNESVLWRKFSNRLPSKLRKQYDPEELKRTYARRVVDMWNSYLGSMKV